MEDSYVLQLLEPKFKECYLSYCGYAQCESLHSVGPGCRPHYLIHYILEGKGIYQAGDKKYKLSKGQGFLIEPETLTFYQADKDEPWAYVWIGVGGTKAKDFIHDIGLNSEQLTFQCPYGEEIKQIVLSMLKHTNPTIACQYFLQGRLYDFFSVLLREPIVDTHQEPSRENHYIQEAVTFIRNQYSAGIGVSDIAAHLNVNRSYLYTLFKENLNMTPKEFLVAFRISRAREMLTLTDFSIEHIAHSCGYRDVLVFSKAFKAQVGETPSVFRKRDRTDTQNRLIASQAELEDIMNKKANILKVSHNKSN